MNAQFSMRARPSKAVDEKTGKPVDRAPVLWITLNDGGGNAPSRPATEADKQRFQAEYRAFQASLKQPGVEAPLGVVKPDLKSVEKPKSK